MSYMNVYDTMYMYMDLAAYKYVYVNPYMCKYVGMSIYVYVIVVCMYACEQTHIIFIQCASVTQRPRPPRYDLQFRQSFCSPTPAIGILTVIQLIQSKSP